MYLGENLYLAASRIYCGDDAKQLFRIHQLSNELHIPMVATNDVHYHHPIRRELQDVVTCIREKCTIYNAGFRLHPNAERYLKPMDEMVRLFRQYPDAMHHTQEIAEACKFSLDELKYEYPKEITSEGRTPQEELTFLTWQGAKELFGERIPEKIKANIKHELAFMKEMNYAEYFLTVYDIVVLQESKVFFARDVDLQLILQFVIAWVLLPLILQNLICCLNGLFLLRAMNHLISMWTLNMNAGKK